MKILQISKKDTVNLKKTLGRNLSEVERQGEDEHDFHYGGFVDGQLVTTASFHLEKNPLIADENQFCLDEVISSHTDNSTHTTKELLKTVFPVMKRNFTKIVWCKTKKKNRKILQELDFKPIDLGNNSEEQIIMVKNL